MRARLVGEHVRRDAAPHELGQHVGGVADEADRQRAARARCASAIQRERLVEARASCGRSSRVARRLSMRDSSTSTPRNAAPCIVAASGCAPPMPPSPAVSTKRPGERAAEVLARDRAEGLVRALQNALRADVDPRAGGHLPVHHEPFALELAEVLPRRPAADEVAVRDQHARRARVRAEHGDRLAALHEQRLVVLERAQRAHDRVERLPVARRLPRAAVHHEIIRALGHLGIEVVHQHAQRGFLLPSLAGERGAARRAHGDARRRVRRAGGHATSMSVGRHRGSPSKVPVAIAVRQRLQCRR